MLTAQESQGAQLRSAEHVGLSVCLPVKHLKSTSQRTSVSHTSKPPLLPFRKPSASPPQFASCVFFAKREIFALPCLHATYCT